MAKLLTQLAVKAAKPKRGSTGEVRRAEYPDPGCTGLYLIVQPSGVKSWALRYRFSGRSRKLTLGSATDGALTLASARKAAVDARCKIEQGIDPVAEKQDARAAAARRAALQRADSVAGLAEQFLDLYAKPRTRARTYRQTEDVLRRLVLPTWRGRSVHDIRRRDVIALIDNIALRNGTQMAGKALAVLSKFFAWLIARDVVDASPCRGVERPAANPPRDRVLDDSEIATLWRACAGAGVAGAAVRLLLATGCRRGEVFGMCVAFGLKSSSRFSTTAAEHSVALSGSINATTTSTRSATPSSAGPTMSRDWSAASRPRTRWCRSGLGGRRCRA